MKRKRQVVWKADRGDGTIFYFVDAETGKKVSPNLYLFYRAAGREHTVSTRTTDLGDAKRDLKRLTRNRENANEGLDTLKVPKTERVTVGDLLDANLRRAEEKKLKSLRKVKSSTEVLKNLLGGVRAVDFRPEHVDRFKERRRGGEGAKKKRVVSDTTVRRALEVLHRAFTYAVEQKVLHYAPHIELPTIENTRMQEIPLEKFPAILAAIACPDVKDFVEWLLLTGMRPHGARELQWEWFDGKTWTLTVPPEKKGKARVFAIEGSLRRIFERRLAARRLGCGFIFHHAGRPMHGNRTRREFYAALEACGLPPGQKGFTLYDTKKTAAGLLIDAGLSEREAMHFTGHKTPSMFDRYVIKSADRHRASVLKRDAYLEERLAESRSRETERVVDFPKASGEK